ncbi:MAG: hypothetical protein GTN78_04330 [Gemmatimonadales bacterium]|nr:hypothetical protein [Gemmatimonadales bacterium]NIQ99413.1 hypothetical protein [Gemmatimonadales bacterium]NIS64081.1 hypothetical protein [Gemmatimonadales bacterium]
MTAERGNRDRRHTRTIGAKPYVGRRFVENGKVRIQWTEQGKRRSKTVGSDSAETRRQADAELEEILERLRASAGEAEAPREEGLRSVEEAVRSWALALTDAADELADWFEEAILGGPGPSETPEETGDTE